MKRCKLMRVNSQNATISDLVNYDPKAKKWVKCKNRIGELSGIACDACIAFLSTHWDSNIRLECVKLPSLRQDVLEKLALDNVDSIRIIAKAKLEKGAK